MDGARGFGLFGQQFCALMKKNCLLSWRNKVAMFLQLSSPFFFVLAVFCTQKAIISRYKVSSWYDDIYDPSYNLVGAITPCEEGIYIKSPCYDFVWSGSNSSVITGIVQNIMANNPGRVIPDSKVKGFETSAEVDNWLMANPMHCTGALHFNLDSNFKSQKLGYGIQTNSIILPKLQHYQDPTLKFQIPLQIAAEREIARHLLGGKGMRFLTIFPRSPSSNSRGSG